MNKSPSIYMIVCANNGAKYVGSANYPPRRFNEHRYWLKRGKHHSHKFQSCWNEHGEDSFSYVILERVENENDIYKREQFWIDTIHPELNVAQFVEGPARGIVRSQEWRDAISAGKKANHARKSPEEKASLADSIRAGRARWWDSLTPDEQAGHIRKISNPHTEETKRILSEKSRANNPRNTLGKHPSPETLEKQRQATQARWDVTRSEREAAKERKRLEFESGRAAREAIRVEKVRRANTGKKRTRAQKDHLRQVALAQQANPEYRIKHQAAVAAKMKDPEVLRRLSESHKGKRLTNEQKAKIGAAHRGRKRSPETVARMKAAQQARRAREKKKSTGG